ncbi:VOC family protein [Chitinibacter sp. ZOR0017]|uniref:VOC family protein n=1 Tax=Chitinibacter sp. ZOR0017 TaxID=1339254 RepID=UPI000645B44C|nr:VOC family protein [Chitinibacter sp. ZOR0017]
MSQQFGEIRQIAFVVPNIDSAMQYWAATLGIGPFFIKRKIQLDNFEYRGKASASPVISIALANSGALQIELIEQHDMQPSIFLEFLQRQPTGGLQHIAAWLSRTEFEQRKTALITQGYQVAQAGKISSSGVELLYFATEQDQTGVIFEIANLAEPEHIPRLEKIAQAAQQWDQVTIAIEVQQ